MILSLLLPISAASPVSQGGFEGEAISRSRGGAALTRGAGSMLLNPGGLAAERRSELLLGYAAIRYDFHELPALWWDVNQDGVVDDWDDPLVVGSDYPRADGFLISATRPLGDRFSLGIDLFLPRDRLLRLHTFDAALPTYFLYENRPHRYELALGAGAVLAPGLQLGGGLRMLPRSQVLASMTVDSSISLDEEGEPSDLISARVDLHEVEMELITDFAPMLGLQWDLGDSLPALDGLHLGAAWQGQADLPVDLSLDLQLNLATEDGELDPVGLALVLDGAVELVDHYLPRQVNLGAGWDREGWLQLHGDLVWTQWSQFLINIGRLVDSELQATLLDLSDVEVLDGNDHRLDFVDTWSWSAGGALRPPAWGSLRSELGLSVGLSPSPLAGQSQQTTLLDSDRLLLGSGLALERDLPSDQELRLQLFGQLQLFAEGSLTRSSDTPRAGYPVDVDTVPIGGRILSGGAQVNWRY